MVFLTAYTSPLLTTPQINDSASDHQYVFAASDLAADRIITLPLLTGPDTFVFEDHAQTLTNKTLTAPVIATISNSGTVTLPTATDTLVGRATTDTLTNKTLNTTTNVVVGALRPGVVAVSVANATLASAYADTTSLDGVTLATGDRILLTAQTSVPENGIWVVAAGAPTRPTDFTGTFPVFGMIVPVETGTSYGNTLWTCTSEDSALVVDTDDNAWGQVTAPMSSISLADLNTNVTDATLVSTAGAETLTNKTLNTTSNVIVGALRPGVVAASVANATLASAYADTTALDGVTLATGDRILLTAQTTASENGIWVVAAGAPTRPTDFTGTFPVFGMIVPVETGTVYGNTLWTCTSEDSALVVDTGSSAWGQVTAPMSSISLADLNTNVTDATLVSTTGAETLTNKTLTAPQINDTSADHQYVVAVSELAADRIVTLPLLTSGDTFVFEDHAQTLTNKTLNLGPSINGDNTVTMYEVQAHSAAHTLTEVNGWLVVSCTTSTAYTITLPAATGSGVITVADVSGGAGSNTLTIARAGTDTINGATTATITAAYNSITLVADGTSAWIMI